ncbi:MAG TPA: DUF892 family protein [Rhabdochlamydiaceae bacterium]|nr:DUF892 family protein [Rhabdochlamydiaceae bacterium]
MKDFYNLFVNELKRIYSAEKQIAAALPKLANAASSPKLKKAINHHLEETKVQIKRLEAIASEIDEKLSGLECQIMKNLLKEAADVGKFHYDRMAKDAALIHAVQRIEHYEIAAYGTLKAFAKQFKLKEVEKLLDHSAKEESHADKTLSKIAEGQFFKSGINTEACKRCA